MANIEIYNYKIIGYSNDMTTSSKFKNIYSSTTTNNDTFITSDIKSEPAKTTSDFQIYSVDPITSINPNSKKPNSGGLSLNLLYRAYKKWKTKTLRFDDITEIYCDNKTNKFKKEVIDFIQNVFKQATKKQYDFCIDEFKKQNSDNASLKLFTDKIHEFAMVLNIEVKNIEQIVIFGDFHGSFHTFFRHMFRLHTLGVIDFGNYKIKDNYRLIFLGDIVDRGMYATEILYIICQFIVNNEQHKIILNRGNHEDITMNSQVNKDSTGTNYLYEEARDKGFALSMYNNLFSSCPSAVILNENKNGKRYWLSHGGFPIFSNDVKINFVANKNIFFMHHEFIKQTANVNVETQIRWNDFFYVDAYGRNYSNSNRGNEMLYKHHIDNFCIENNINFIIRGHQDSEANAFLIKNNNHIYMMGQFQNHLDYLHNNFPNTVYVDKTFEVSKYSFHQVNGPVDIINTYTIKRTHLPVLTISTNTDRGRNLNTDSFIIMKFFSEDVFEQQYFKNDIKDFTQIDKKEEKNNDISSSSSSSSYIPISNSYNSSNASAAVANINTDVQTNIVVDTSANTITNTGINETMYVNNDRMSNDSIYYDNINDTREEFSAYYDAQKPYTYNEEHENTNYDSDDKTVNKKYTMEKKSDDDWSDDD